LGITTTSEGNDSICNFISGFIKANFRRSANAGFLQRHYDKIHIKNSQKNQPLDGNALLDFVMNEVYFQKIAILKFYSPLNDQVKAELRKT
jgi:hypothetical protein